MDCPVCNTTLREIERFPAKRGAALRWLPRFRVAHTALLLCERCLDLHYAVVAFALERASDRHAITQLLAATERSEAA